VSLNRPVWDRQRASEGVGCSLPRPHELDIRRLDLLCSPNIVVVLNCRRRLHGGMETSEPYFGPSGGYLSNGPKRSYECRHSIQTLGLVKPKIIEMASRKGRKAGVRVCVRVRKQKFVVVRSCAQVAKRLHKQSNRHVAMRRGAGQPRSSPPYLSVFD
jgi:hypothetical protein